MPTPPTTQIDPIKIFYPNGGNEAVQMYVWDGVKPVLWDGSVTFSGTITLGTVGGSLSNNTAAPAANNIGVLPAVVSTTNLGYTAGNQALLRVDTTGALIIAGTISVSTTGLALASNQTDGSQKTQVVNTTGATQAFGAGTTTTTTVRVVLPTDQTSIPVSITTGSAVIGHVIVDSGNVNSTVSGTVTATISNATLAVVGNIAHDSADSGNPIKIGNKAISYGTNPTGVTANDRTDAYANVAGIPFFTPGHPNLITLLTNFTSSTTNSALITVSGGTKIVVASCTIAADAANTVKPSARAGFGTTNTPTTTGVYISHPGIPAGGGIRQAGFVAGADGDDFRFTCAVPTGGSLDVVVQYFTIES